MAADKKKSYCEYVADLEASSLHRIYHDSQYGFPIESDNELFGRLVLEINQAGLSWATILNKQENFRKAFSGYNIQKVANYREKDIERLLSDPGIIRNQRKIGAAVYNAQQILILQKENGSFRSWLDKNHPLNLEEWIKLFKKTFKFTGPEITNEFLVSTAYLKGAHIKDCPVFEKISRQKPMWQVL